MRIPPGWTSEISYFRKLLGAGLNAATTVQSDTVAGARKPDWALAARQALAPTVIGMAVGVSAVCLAKRAKPGRKALFGALVGGAFGFGAFAWSSRNATSVIVHRATKKMGAVRDDRWLEKHPICYG